MRISTVELTGIQADFWSIPDSASISKNRHDLKKKKIVTKFAYSGRRSGVGNFVTPLYFFILYTVSLQPANFASVN